MTVKRGSHKFIVRKVGIPISDGVGEGKAWVVGATVPGVRSRRRINPRHHAREEGLVRHAIQLLSFVIENAIFQVAARAGEEHAQIFVALKEMLHDPVVLERIVAYIREEDLNAFAAVEKAFGEFKNELQSSSLTRIRDRVQDVMEIERGLLDALVNPLSLVDEEEEESGNGRRWNRVVVSRHLTPRLVIEMRGRRLRGIVTEEGGETSHGAILCRALGIPAVSEVRGIWNEAQRRETRIALDGSTGEVVISSQSTNPLSYLRETIEPESAVTDTETFKEVHIYANVNLSEHARQAIASGAEGVGLYRTELEFLAAGKFLSEREQAVCYRNLVLTMMGLPVVIRLLDFSHDKLAPLEEHAPEGIDFDVSRTRFMLKNKQVMRAQARAIAQVVPLGPVKVLYPMVEDADHFAELKNAFEESLDNDFSGQIQHGAMFELPSACEDADRLCEASDFVSLGTNDLMHYLFNIDRNRGKDLFVSREAEDPLLWQTIGKVAEAARKHNLEVTVCGEIASQPRLLQRFIELGVMSISVDISKIRRIKALYEEPIEPAPEPQEEHTEGVVRNPFE